MNIYQKYLDFLLWLKLPHVAFAVSERWAKSRAESKVEVALELQLHLIAYYGYHECPHCHWATRQELEHVRNPLHACALAHFATCLIGAIREGFVEIQSGMRPLPKEPPRPTIH